MVDLLPRGVGACRPASARDVRQESSGATVVASFAGPWRQWLVFDITVVNRSDSVLEVAPEQFSISLARSRGQRTRVLGRSIHAVGPERTLDVLDRGQSRESLLWGALLGLEGAVMVANVVSAIAGSAQETPEDQDAHAQLAEDLLALGRATLDASGARMEDLDDEHYRWARSALLRTALAPGASVSGTIALPGAPFRRLLAPYEPLPEGDWTITGPPKRPPRGYRLTLHAPSNLGGQRFEFDVSRP
jgi:hypothetical protein